MASARDRYRQSAAGEWERAHAGPQTKWIDEDGNAHEMLRPENPFKAKNPCHDHQIATGTTAADQTTGQATVRATADADRRSW